jgi:hypothetical protein
MCVYLTPYKYQCKDFEMEGNMSQNPITDFLVDELELDDEFSADDFEFIIGPDGELKSMMIPEHLMEDPPEEVQLILKMFGIDDINQLGNRTLH